MIYSEPTMSGMCLKLDLIKVVAESVIILPATVFLHYIESILKKSLSKLYITDVSIYSDRHNYVATPSLLTDLKNIHLMYVTIKEFTGECL